MKDSRQVKVEYELNRGANVQGMLTSPREIGYLFYMFMHGISKMNLNKTAKGDKGIQVSKLYGICKKPKEFYHNRQRTFQLDDSCDRPMPKPESIPVIHLPNTICVNSKMKRTS